MSSRPKIPADARASLSRAAALTRHHPERVEEIADARRQAKYLALAAYIRRSVDEAPPLTFEQQARLAAMLTPGGGRGV